MEDNLKISTRNITNSFYSPQIKSEEYPTKQQEYFNSLFGAESNPLLKNKDGKPTSLSDSTPLHEACLSGSIASVKTLLSEGMDPFKTNFAGQFPLDLAAARGQWEICDYLIQFMSSTKDISTLPSNALLLALTNGKHDVAKLLIKKGINVHHKNGKNVNALMLAAQENQSSILKILLENGLNVNEKDALGYSPLHYAASKNAQLSITFLLENGGDPNSLNEKLSCPLVSAIIGRAPEAACLLAKSLNTGVLHQKVHGGKTLLHLALEFGNPELAKILIDAGIDVTAVTNKGESVLHLAANSGNIELIKYLINTGKCSLDETLPDGRNVLHIAAGSGHISLTKYLIEEIGMSIEATDALGRNPLYFATVGRSPDIGRYLISKGAPLYQSKMPSIKKL